MNLILEKFAEDRYLEWDSKKETLTIDIAGGEAIVRDGGGDDILLTINSMYYDAYHLKMLAKELKKLSKRMSK